MPYEQTLIGSTQFTAYDSRDGNKRSLTSRTGSGFDEFIEPTPCLPGLYDSTTQVETPSTWGSAGETIANFTPKEPLLPNETYTVEVLQDGIEDLSRNKFATTTTFTFSTVGN